MSQILEIHERNINQSIVTQRQHFKLLRLLKYVRFQCLNLIERCIKDLQLQEELHVVLFQSLNLILADIDNFDCLLAEPARL